MKQISRWLSFVVMIATLLLAACGGATAAPTANPGGGKVETIPVAFIGTVDSMAGDQWVINGQTVTVSADVLRGGPFNMGDRVKVEGVVNADGSFRVSKVEAPTQQDSSTLPQFGDDNSNSSPSVDVNGNEANANDSNINAANPNDDNSNSINSNDDNSNSVNSNDVTNINDDNGNDANSNDDSVSNSNSDDSQDDNSNSDSNHNGGDDHGNGGGSDDSDGGSNDNGNGG